METLGQTRARALLQFDILDTPAEACFDAITKLAAEICRAPFVAISFLDEGRQWFKSQVGLGVRETPASQSFCAYTVRHDEPFVIRDASKDARFATNKLVKSGPRIKFYAGIPLRSSEGVALGALCILDNEARPAGLLASELSALQVLATQVEAQLELRRAIKERDAQLLRILKLAKDLQHAANHDSLTSLPNRKLLSIRLGEAIEASERSGAPLALVQIDIDRFKLVNDSLGQEAGDALLKRFAQHLKKVIRSPDTAARTGGDEFALLLVGAEAGADVTALLDSLRQCLMKPMVYRGRKIDYQVSIGIAHYPKDARTAEELAVCSDLALAAAKSERGSVVSFRADLKVDFEKGQQSVASVRKALADDEFAPFYQPKFDLATGALVGFEALTRWYQQGVIRGMPPVFLPEFPDSRLVAQVGARMTTRILDDVAEWARRDLRIGHVAINSCAADFAGGHHAGYLLHELQKRGIPPALIELEVTEGVFMGRGSSLVARALNILSDAGMRIALDDFGTGHASLTQLKNFPIDVLKIDRSFVAGIGQSADDTAIVRAIVGLSESLGMESVAEGIETEEQAVFLRRAGCNIGQGYLYGAAIAASDVTEVYLTNQKCLAA